MCSDIFLMTDARFAQIWLIEAHLFQKPCTRKTEEKRSFEPFRIEAVALLLFQTVRDLWMHTEINLFLYEMECIRAFSIAFNSSSYPESHTWTCVYGSDRKKGYIITMWLWYICFRNSTGRVLSWYFSTFSIDFSHWWFVVLRRLGRMQGRRALVKRSMSTETK